MSTCVISWFWILYTSQLLLFPLGGHTCTDTINLYQIGGNRYDQEGIAIIPRLSFTCNGRITNIMARILQHDAGNIELYPYLQIWRPSSSMSMIYNKVDEVLVEQSHLERVDSPLRPGTLIANITLTGDDRILVQSGDVVGFYHQPNSRYQVRTSTETVQGYVLYLFAGSNVGTLNLNDATAPYNGRQPLIQFTLGKLHSFLELRNFLLFLRYSV